MLCSSSITRSSLWWILVATIVYHGRVCFGQQDPQLMAEIQRLRSEVARLSEAPAGGAVHSGGPVAKNQQQSAGIGGAFGSAASLLGGLGPGGATGGAPNLAVGSGRQMGYGGLGGAMAGLGGALGTLGGAMPSATAPPADRCLSNPLFAELYGALQKLALLEHDPVEASYQINAAWEEDPSLFEVCPVGIITALVYLSIAQERDWKYKLLHRATYLLYSTPGVASKMLAGKWPISDRLVRTMYYNSEVKGRVPLRFGDALAQPRSPTQAALDPGVDEAVGLSLQNRDSVSVHFSKVLFYHFYHNEQHPCACRTRSWCLPRWVRHLTNHTVDVWLAARDEQKTLFRMDKTGCFRSLGVGLATHHIADIFDVVFVFEINAFMHPQARVVPAQRMLLYPTFDLNQQQMSNFEELGTSVLPDDGMLKPPNPGMRQLIEEAASSRRSKLQRPRDRLLIYPADIRPFKGQLDFLSGLLQAGSRAPGALQRLRGLTVVIAGGCDGNQTYCEEVMRSTELVNQEGIVNIVVADSLKDDEIAQFYAAALGVVLYSRVDCNPRTIYEGFHADAPFFATEMAQLPPHVHHLGHISNGDPAQLPEQLADFVEFSESGGFAGRPAEFARRHLNEADVYGKIVRWMDQKYLSGPKLDPVIRSEDALSGAFGNLGGLLGGKSAGAADGMGGLAGLFAR